MLPADASHKRTRLVCFGFPACEFGHSSDSFLNYIDASKPDARLMLVGSCFGSLALFCLIRNVTRHAAVTGEELGLLVLRAGLDSIVWLPVAIIII